MAEIVRIHRCVSCTAQFCNFLVGLTYVVAVATHCRPSPIYCQSPVGREWRLSKAKSREHWIKDTHDSITSEPVELEICPCPCPYRPLWKYCRGQTFTRYYRNYDNPNHNCNSCCRKSGNTNTCDKSQETALNCLYFNACSLINKLDYFEAIADAFDLDMISITELWTAPQILDS